MDDFVKYLRAKIKLVEIKKIMFHSHLNEHEKIIDNAKKEYNYINQQGHTIIFKCEKNDINVTMTDDKNNISYMSYQECIDFLHKQKEAEDEDEDKKEWTYDYIVELLLKTDYRLDHYCEYIDFIESLCDNDELFCDFYEGAEEDFYNELQKRLNEKIPKEICDVELINKIKIKSKIEIEPNQFNVCRIKLKDSINIFCFLYPLADNTFDQLLKLSKYFNYKCDNINKVTLIELLNQTIEFVKK